MKSQYSLLPAFLFSLASSHCVITKAVGINAGEDPAQAEKNGAPFSRGFANDPDVQKLRDISISNAEVAQEGATGEISEPVLQFDAPIMNKDEIKNKIVNKCGRTSLQFVDMGSGLLDAATSGNLAQVKNGGQLALTVFQVNQDGGGPFTASMDVDGQGKFDKEIEVVQNADGVGGLSNDGARDHTIILQMPDDLGCGAGPDQNQCIFRLDNDNSAGTFGGCVSAAQVDGNKGGNGGNNGKGNGNGDENGQGENQGKGAAQKKKNNAGAKAEKADAAAGGDAAKGDAKKGAAKQRKNNKRAPAKKGKKQAAKQGQADEKKNNNDADKGSKQEAAAAADDAEKAAGKTADLTVEQQRLRGVVKASLAQAQSTLGQNGEKGQKLVQDSAVSTKDGDTIGKGGAFVASDNASKKAGGGGNDNGNGNDGQAKGKAQKQGAKKQKN